MTITGTRPRESTFAVPDDFFLFSLLNHTPFSFSLTSLGLTLNCAIMSATKAQSQKIFEKVKLKAANKVRPPPPEAAA